MGATRRSVNQFPHQEEAAMDSTRKGWFRVGVAVTSVFCVYALLDKAGLFGTGRYSIWVFSLFVLAALGLERLLSGVLGMIWVAVAPVEKLRD
jgi:hypothetical protein